MQAIEAPEANRLGPANAERGKSELSETFLGEHRTINYAAEPLFFDVGFRHSQGYRLSYSLVSMSSLAVPFS